MKEIIESRQERNFNDFPKEVQEKIISICKNNDVLKRYENRLQSLRIILLTYSNVEFIPLQEWDFDEIDNTFGKLIKNENINAEFSHHFSNHNVFIVRKTISSQKSYIFTFCGYSTHRGYLTIHEF